MIVLCLAFNVKYFLEIMGQLLLGRVTGPNFEDMSEEGLDEGRYECIMKENIK